MKQPLRILAALIVSYLVLLVYMAFEFMNGFATIMSSWKMLLDISVFVFCSIWLSRRSKWAWWVLLAHTIHRSVGSALLLVILYRENSAEAPHPEVLAPYPVVVVVWSPFMWHLLGQGVLLLAIAVVLLLPTTRKLFFGKSIADDRPEIGFSS